MYLQKKSHNILSEFMILCWVTFIVTLGHMCPMVHRLDTPDMDYHGYYGL